MGVLFYVQASYSNKDKEDCYSFPALCRTSFIYDENECQAVARANGLDIDHFFVDNQGSKGWKMAILKTWRLCLFLIEANNAFAGNTQHTQERCTELTLGQPAVFVTMCLKDVCMKSF